MTNIMISSLLMTNTSMLNAQQQFFQSFTPNSAQQHFAQQISTQGLHPLNITSNQGTASNVSGAVSVCVCLCFV
jgi:hypothetical protein